MGVGWRAWTILAALLVGTPAGACPLCDSANGERVRAGIRADFGANLLATTLPVVACLGLGLAVGAIVGDKRQGR